VADAAPPACCPVLLLFPPEWHSALPPDVVALRQRALARRVLLHPRWLHRAAAASAQLEKEQSAPERLQPVACRAQRTCSARLRHALERLAWALSATAPEVWELLAWESSVRLAAAAWARQEPPAQHRR
jgi:hypothetical protein